MKKLLLVAAVALLSACGSGGQRGPENAGASNAACTLIPDASALFGAGADVVGYAGLDGMEATCEWTSADGARSGDIVLYTAVSLGSVTLDAKTAEIIENWDAQTETPLAPVPELGEGAQIATDLVGYQTQILLRQGDRLILIMAGSGDSAITGEALARNMANAITPPA
ncbi:MAG: hypothetical protein KF779_09310 [Hyphomonadaceae bacterium]|nr:hypothetical protein [Hyphomonadaceae bacterium]